MPTDISKVISQSKCKIQYEKSYSGSKNGCFLGNFWRYYTRDQSISEFVKDLIQ